MTLDDLKLILSEQKNYKKLPKIARYITPLCEEVAKLMTSNHILKKMIGDQEKRITALEKKQEEVKV